MSAPERHDVKAASASQRPVASGSERERPVRGDIQALRAIAVVAVMLFHLWPDRLTGGYVGVDVFFVISGFLITSHLVREAETSGRIRITVFWARRARRLLPAALLTLVVTAIGVVVWVPRSLWNDFLQEILASTLYVENWLLSYKSVDYLASSLPPSPVQHFWTLSVEEQFYIALPMVLALGIVVATARSWPARRVLLMIIVAGTAASFAYSAWLTARSGSLAYFPTTTRAWEFGAGALIGFLAVHPPRRWANVLTATGIVAICFASISFSASTPFPGWAALIPVGGSMLVIWAGANSFASRVGDAGPVAFTGRVSYGIYLWHWPLIVLIPYATGVANGNVMNLAIIAASLTIAWASTRFLEDPVRFSPALLGGRRPRTVAIALGTAMVVVLMVAAAPLLWNRVDLQRQEALDAALLAGDPECLGAAVMMTPSVPCSNPALDGEIVPFPAAREADDSNRDECWAKMGQSALHLCSLGPSSGYSKHIIAVGDSHNNTLVGMYEKIAEENDWRIDVTGRGGCYWTTARQARAVWDVAPCREWRDELQELLTTEPFDAVITTHSTTNNDVIAEPGETRQQSTVNGLAEAWGPVAARGIPIVAIVDNPQTTREMGYCVERLVDRSDDVDGACALPRAVALEAFDGSVEAAERTPGSHVIDMTNLYCTDDECPSIIGHVLVYRDETHVTATWAGTLAPYVAEELERLLTARDGGGATGGGVDATGDGVDHAGALPSNHD
ncbi:MAG: acyltransferase family protein [Leifsonia sp.]